MKDANLLELAARVDETLLDWCMNSQMSPLALSGVVLARLSHLNDIVTSGDDFRELCVFVSQNSSASQREDSAEPTDFTQANQWLEQFRHQKD